MIGYEQASHVSSYSHISQKAYCSNCLEKLMCDMMILWSEQRHFDMWKLWIKRNIESKWNERENWEHSSFHMNCILFMFTFHSTNVIKDFSVFPFTDENDNNFFVYISKFTRICLFSHIIDSIIFLFSWRLKKNFIIYSGETYDLLFIARVEGGKTEMRKEFAKGNGMSIIVIHFVYIRSLICRYVSVV